MEVKIVTHIGADMQNDKWVVDKLVEQNISTKLDNYLNKFSKADAEGLIEVTTDKNKKWLFDGKIQANLDGKSFRFEREDYKNLDDLINHLFEHFKESLSAL